MTTKQHSIPSRRILCTTQTTIYRGPTVWVQHIVHHIDINTKQSDRIFIIQSVSSNWVDRYSLAFRMKLFQVIFVIGCVIAGVFGFPGDVSS